ncbi:ABC transporter ATP-binding protein [Paenibacillus caui]|uniref:ABC transporter ATP-binding protein n=1 Tax=Paenibacillus caui TaxID=2873927 RepID=UPI001CA8EB6A|nr:ABC transporter ATP-binding protein [Paenibacillus caui]
MATNERERAVLSLKGVTKRIGGKTIVEGLGFELFPGEIVGLLGPNGAGKTTTIRMIVGLIGMTEGDISIGGHSIRSEFTKAIRHVGGIIENPEFYPYMTGLDNLKQYRRMTDGITDERFQEVIRLVGLEDALNKRVKAYSLGMRQRLGIAQALLHKPSLLILDEPTNGLDPAGIREMRDYLKEIASKEGIAILISSHLLSEIEQICGRVVVIQNGKLVTVRDIGEQQNKAERSQIEVVVRATPLTVARQALDRLDMVQVTRVFEERNELLLSLKDEDIPLVVKALGEHDAALYRIEEAKSTLEEEFLKWTGGNRIA